MTQAVVIDAADDTIAVASSKMREQQTGSLLVMEGKNLLGIFTERDLLKAVAAGQDPTATLLKDVMSTEVITISPGATLKQAATLMASKWIRHLPVVKEGEVQGIISQRDLAGVLAQMLNEPDRLTGEAELPREKRLHRIEAGDLD